MDLCNKNVHFENTNCANIIMGFDFGPKGD